MPTANSPAQNTLLAALPVRDFERLVPHLQLVQLPRGEVLGEAGTRLGHVYFPVTSTISLLCVTADGASDEIAVVGAEGIVGISVFMGGASMPSRAVVLAAGAAYRLTSKTLEDEFARGGALQQVLLRYTQALMTQVAQTSVCNRHHSLQQRMSGFLLRVLDRASSSDIVLTQELIASLLGVRREGVTEAAGELQRAGTIHYRRGHIAVVNRTALEAQSCECYAVVKKEYARVLPGRWRSDTLQASGVTDRPRALPRRTGFAVKTFACGPAQ